jgi:hypothetical protein
MARWRISVLFFLLWQASAVQAGSPKKLLLLAQGPDGHPPQTHEYVAGLKVLQILLQKVPDLETTLVLADEPWREGPELLARADGAVVFLSEGARWLHQDPKRLEAFQRLAQRKGGLVGLHWGIGTKDAKNIEGFVNLLGGCHGGPDRKYKVLTDAECKIADPKHPIATGIKDFKVRDEFYYHLKLPRAADKVVPLVQVPIDGRVEMVAWAWDRPDGGRSFGFSGLHFHDNWGRPEYRRLVTQGVVWSLGVPIPPSGLPVDISEKDLRVK